MTVTPAMVMQVSPFSVSDSGDFDETDFERYKAWAKEELDRDNPGLPSAAYDQAHANLICDIFASSKGGREFKSEKIGPDYSYTKDGGNKTSYRLRYEEILRQFVGEQPSAGQERIDIETPSDFRLDQLGLAEFDTDDDLE